MTFIEVMQTVRVVVLIFAVALLIYRRWRL